MSALTIESLTVGDIGTTVRVTTYDGTTITGPLRGIHVEPTWVESFGFDRPAGERIPGRATIRLDIGPWSSGPLPTDTALTIAPEDTA